MGYLLPHDPMQSLLRIVTRTSPATNNRFYDAAAVDIGKDIGRVEYWQRVPLIGKWIADFYLRRVERKTGHVVEIAVDEGRLLALPLEDQVHTELEQGEIVTVNRKNKFEVLDVSHRRVVLG